MKKLNNIFYLLNFILFSSTLVNATAGLITVKSNGSGGGGNCGYTMPGSFDVDVDYLMYNIEFDEEYPAECKPLANMDCDLYIGVTVTGPNGVMFQNFDKVNSCNLIFSWVGAGNDPTHYHSFSTSFLVDLSDYDCVTYVNVHTGFYCFDGIGFVAQDVCDPSNSLNPHFNTPFQNGCISESDIMHNYCCDEDDSGSNVSGDDDNKDSENRSMKINSVINSSVNLTSNEIYVNGEFNDLESLNLKIFDINGQLITSNPVIRRLTNSRLTVDIGNLEDGIYILNVQDANVFYSSKILNFR